MSVPTGKADTIKYLVDEITIALNRHKDHYGHRKCAIDIKWHLHVRKSDLAEVMTILRRTMPRLRREGRYLVEPR